MFSVLRHRQHRHLLSFPTRRSSDLMTGTGKAVFLMSDFLASIVINLRAVQLIAMSFGNNVQSPAALLETIKVRSEEHTSELQSRENLVCRLLLEKKKQQCHEI